MELFGANENSALDTVIRLQTVANPVTHDAVVEYNATHESDYLSDSMTAMLSRYEIRATRLEDGTVGWSTPISGSERIQYEMKYDDHGNVMKDAKGKHSIYDVEDRSGKVGRRDSIKGCTD